MVRLLSSCLRRGALTYITNIQSRHVLPNQARLPQWVKFQQQRCLHGEYEPEFEFLSSESPPPPPPPSEPEPEAEAEATAEPLPEAPETPSLSPAWAAFYDSFHYQPATVVQQYPQKWRSGQEVVVHGFLGKRRDQGSGLSFCDLETSNYAMQIVSTWREEGSLQHTAYKSLRGIPTYSPVSVKGTLVESDRQVLQTEHTNNVSEKAWDLRLRSIECLNPFPKDIIVSKEAVWSPAQRHLQLRFDPALRERLRLRGSIMHKMRTYLRGVRMEEVETPLLFKSTPEGAREFLVPTRRPGYAYALPQSPQQYKQILMASGLPGYFQFAKCFRDEDHRADRQPEFTQLDLEMPFANGFQVREQIQAMLNYVLRGLAADFSDGKPTTRSRKPYRKDQQSLHLVDEEALASSPVRHQSNLPLLPVFLKYYTMSFDYAMRKFGTDKPDLRITPVHVSNIHRIEDIVPADFTSKITHLENPIVEAVRFRFNGASSVGESAEFIQRFMEGTLSGPGAAFKPPKYASPGSTPAVLICDPSRPVSGLSALGHEAASRLLEFGHKDWHSTEEGDVIVVHARERLFGAGAGAVGSENNNAVPADNDDGTTTTTNATGVDGDDGLGFGGYGGITGGATDLGRLRHSIYHAALKEGLIVRKDSRRHDEEPRSIILKAVWIYNFPLFTPKNKADKDPGQGGTAGFSSTHHPFTAPLAASDLELLRSGGDPLRAKADHYDLVINGVEVGGGSRRIHVAEVQEFVLRQVLGMDDAGVGQFAHLLGALRAGCPPHAGFAIGFDRLLTVLWDLPSVRDVMAFPKNNKGEDPLVKSPGRTTAEQQRAYHLFRMETE